LGIAAAKAVALEAIARAGRMGKLQQELEKLKNASDTGETGLLFRLRPCSVTGMWGLMDLNRDQQSLPI
jgi:hypothetical protein